ncbi:phage baseplate protein [Amycolatopsis anabasis]|uniref:T4 family baseplate hub assembly chaperone n=1 Tax=Amycolatopsis anabasis TaxID=1840409 RepID=UPI00131BF128|nr:phage baseplate protein [Amycolatopsis anabasis]
MAALTEAGLLATWEAALGQGPVRRALALATAGGAEPATVADLSVGRREEFVLALRERCFGATFSCAVTCPSCEEELELELGLDDVRAAPPPDGENRITAHGFEVEFRPITSRDLLAVRRDLPDARRRLLERCVLSARRRGRKARKVPDEVLDAVAAELSTRDPQADVRLDLDCASCGHEWRSPFDVTAFLWAEMEAYARRLLHEVHALATVYGWSEREVLAVSPARRRCYLEMAGQ